MEHWCDKVDAKFLWKHSFYRNLIKEITLTRPEESYYGNVKLKPKIVLINCYLNPFVPNAPFFYSLKTSENLMVFWCSQGLEKGCIGKEWVKKFKTLLRKILKMLLFSFHFTSSWKVWPKLIFFIIKFQNNCEKREVMNVQLSYFKTGAKSGGK